ncbi:MAG: endonuclease/exonuclease/phosphatase family protein [Calditrichaeota bacterium]|nr:endonuclease/exonuclease/phosphatase family protein [Calditrichota bacterium]
MRLFIFIGFVWLTIFLLSCNKRITSTEDGRIPDSLRIDVPEFGAEETLDIVSWNIQNFPKLGTETISDVVEIIIDLNADIFGMQEIEDTISFREVLNRLPDYSGIYSLDIYSDGSYQKTGVIYKQNIISISDVKLIFTGDSYRFPRPPLQIYMSASSNLKTFDFTLIVLHLKALGGEQNEDRRRKACEKLKYYLDTEIVGSSDKDYIVVGDWNDELDDPPEDNVFQVFINDSQDYTFLSSILLENPFENATYIGNTRSIIDHILISADARQEYGNGTTAVIKLDQYFSSYVYEVSDHRPVGARFQVFD